ncbi:MAG: NAD-dependent epimerase/dehydratase family protein, partial [Armatimonadota bacterium]|nr:NAD-dependent epimerase/dehydratase family protein [Armatimonadota bacterium]
MNTTSNNFLTIDRIENIKQLEDMLSQPTEGVIGTLGKMEGDILILGVGGKMGPSLARMAKRASDAAGVRRKVIGVDIFPSPEQESKLRDVGIETIKCNLLDPDDITKLPDAPNIVFMVGMKFGTTGQEALTWAINALLPGMVCQRYKGSKFVVFSTGNVYGLTPVALGGSVETAPPNPEGEYATSALGRERIFEHFSLNFGIPTAIIRLNYAVEMRYGVLVDIAEKVWSGEEIDLTMGNVNVIWQGDAIAMALQAFDYVASPPFVVNVTGASLLYLD